MYCRQMLYKKPLSESHSIVHSSTMLYSLQIMTASATNKEHYLHMLTMKDAIANNHQFMRYDDDDCTT